MIQGADVIIADCSGRNANVFYELGLAHAHGKQVILITKDSVQEAPSDIRHFEFIHYEIEKHVAFLERLDNALHHALFEAYKPLYVRARDILDRFIKDTNCKVGAANEEVFFRRVKDAERARGIPTGDEQAALVEFLLPRIVEDSTDADIMKAIVSWTSRQGSSTTS